MRLERSQGARRGGSNNGGQTDKVNLIMERHLCGITKGVLEATVDEWSSKLKAAKTTIRGADPDLVMLELEQVQRPMSKYNVQPLGYLKTEKPKGYKRFMATQLNNISTTLNRRIKIELSTRLVNKYDVDMQSCLELGTNFSRLPPSKPGQLLRRRGTAMFCDSAQQT